MSISCVATAEDFAGDNNFPKQVKLRLGCFSAYVGVYLFVLSFYLFSFFVSVDIILSVTWLFEDEVQNEYY